MELGRRHRQFVGNIGHISNIGNVGSLGNISKSNVIIVGLTCGIFCFNVQKRGSGSGPQAVC